MRWLDRLLTRRRHRAEFERVPRHLRRRLRLPCRQLSARERRLAERLGLPVPPRLSLVDEEAAVLVDPAQRARIEAGE